MRTPNTQRSQDGFVVITNLDIFDKENVVAKSKDQKQKLEKEIKALQELLKNWNDLVEKKRKAAEASNISVDNPSLWQICTPKAFSKLERQVFLKMSVPNSGVLSKNEAEHIKVLRDKNVTYLCLLADVQTLETKLVTLQKEYDASFPSGDDSPTVNNSVEFVEEEINDDINVESCQLLEID